MPSLLIGSSLSAIMFCPCWLASFFNTINEKILNRMIRPSFIDFSATSKKHYLATLSSTTFTRKENVI